MTLTRQEAMRLYDNANCTGEPDLFSSASRNDFETARERCKYCPVRDLCLEHVNPEIGFTGTCAGRLWYDGVDVTEIPDALPPPVYRENDVDPDLAVEVNDAFIAEDADWGVYNESTFMAAVWRLRRHGYRAARIARVTEQSKERIVQLTDHFEEEASAELKDFIKDAYA